MRKTRRKTKEGKQGRGTHYEENKEEEDIRKTRRKENIMRKIRNRKKL